MLLVLEPLGGVSSTRFWRAAEVLSRVSTVFCCPPRVGCWVDRETDDLMPKIRFVRSTKVSFGLPSGEDELVLSRVVGRKDTLDFEWAMALRIRVAV